MSPKKSKAGKYEGKTREAVKILDTLDEYGIRKYREILLEMHANPYIHSAHNALTNLGLTSAESIKAIDIVLKKYR